MNIFWKFLPVLMVEIVKADVPFHITNKGGEILWIGIQGNPNNPNLNNGGFKLNPGETITVLAPDNWQGRLWGRTGCDDQTNHCVTGDCGDKLECAGSGGVPPVTLVEITLKGDSGLDNYDVSLVDGYNIEASIEPVNGQSDGSDTSCKKGECGNNVNDQCPPELQQKNGDQVVACKSACLAFNTDEYCCKGAHDTRETCQRSDWPTDYAAPFKNACPNAYSYAYDDPGSLMTCKANEYIINFGGV
uniref:PR-5-like protein n=1 Tax=Diaprepes abbreviatus TaxID=13040 RepID=Q5I209_DIAAB|nr:PR-5-like protein [Diaprepes abbreviatus]